MAVPGDWPEELDACVAAPRFHVVLLENASVRVLETRVQPGETVPLHTHRWPGILYVRTWSDLVRRDAGGTVLFDSRVEASGARAGGATWADALPPHTLENVGDGELFVITVECKG